MNIMYDLSELITDLFYFGTIDGPDVSYIAVGDHQTDVILLEESLYNHIWSYWNYTQVLLQNSNPSGNASPSGVPDQPDEQHQDSTCSSPPPGTPPAEVLQMSVGASSSGPPLVQTQPEQWGTSRQTTSPDVKQLGTSSQAVNPDREE